MSFLILHGFGGNPPDHWQTWLAGRLRDSGETVNYPDLPKPLEPRLDEWLAVIEPARADTVVCHSLACLLWLHHTARGGWSAERLLFVAPPCVDVPDARGFQPAPAPRLDNALLVHSDDDPWCPQGASAAFAHLGLPAVRAGAGHVNPEFGYGPWPEAEAWCRGDDAAFG